MYCNSIELIELLLLYYCKLVTIHGYYDQKKIDDQPKLFSDLYKRVSFSIEDGGMALRSIDSVYLTAFISSMAASFKYVTSWDRGIAYGITSTQGCCKFER